MNTTDKIKRKYFPKSYAKEKEEREIEEKGIGIYIADKFINAVRKELNRNNGL